MPDATTANGPKLTDDPEARCLVREAHARMYRWPKEFGGYLDSGRPARVIRSERRSQHTDDYIIEP